MPQKKTAAKAKARGSRSTGTKHASAKSLETAQPSKGAERVLANARPAKAKRGDVVVVKIARSYLSPMGTSEVGVRKIRNAVREVAKRTSGIGALKKLDKEF